MAEQNNDERSERVLDAMAKAAVSGVQSTSVDGVSVTKMSAADRKLILDELKKSEVTEFPIAFAKWK